MQTGLKSVDSVFGGLPIGISVFVGEGGSGKSLLAKAIAKSVAKQKAGVSVSGRANNVLYASSESYKDDPGEPVIFLDYLQYKPKWFNVIAELEVFIQHYKPSVVVLDSSTRLFSVTSKAIEESDLSPAMWKLSELAQKYSVAVIAISEVRGYGSRMYPAGGMSIQHAADLYVEFNRIPITTTWDSATYSADMGDIVHTLSITKDKEGVADTSAIFDVQYVDEKPYLRNLKDIKVIGGNTNE